MYDENRDMSACQKCIYMFDAYIDKELTEEQSAFVASHIASCESCAKKLSTALLIRDCALGMDDGIAVPLGAQSAWRRAVRSEIAGRKRRRLIKTVSGIAAAFILMVGSTFALRNTDLLYPPRDNAGAVAISSIQKDELLIASIPADNGLMSSKMRTADGITTMGVLQSDGETEDSGNADELATVSEDAPVEDESSKVRIATREAQTDAFDGDRQALTDLVSEYGGFISSDSVDHQATARVGQYKIRVPDDYLDDFLVAFENIGKTVSISLESDDISAHYYDANSRLNTAIALVARLNELIPQADADSIADLKTRLDAAYNEIDELERIISTYDTDMSYATVYLTLYEVSKLPLATPEPSLGERSSSGFNQSLDAIGNFFGDMVVSMAVIAPVAGSILLGAAIVFCIAYYIGKKKSKQTDGGEKKE